MYKNYTTLRPWYGTWPPKIRSEDNNMKAKTTWSDRRLTIIMFVVFLLGIIALLGSYTMSQKGVGDQQLVHDTGIAFMVAGILGISVDQTLRRQLAQDAFKASIGYLLPDELRNEMEWIYNCHILCVEHSQICELYHIDDETCGIKTKMLRKFRNVSSSKESLALGVGIDEWFHKTGISKILAFGYTKLNTKSDQFELVRSTHSVTVKEQKVDLAPGEEITAWFEVEEIKRRNDVQDWVFACPTLNPTITVRAFEEILIDVGFGYRTAGEELGTGTYILKGTLLPSQRIEIRWWEKEKGERWLKETQQTNL